MGSGKSTQALQIRHNLTARGLSVLLTTQLDRQVGKVSSRLGVAAEAEIVDPPSICSVSHTPPNSATASTP